MVLRSITCGGNREYPHPYMYCNGYDENNHYHQVLDDLNPQHHALRKMIPEMYRGFAEMSNGALTSGASKKKSRS